MNNIIDLTGSDGEEEVKNIDEDSIEKTLKHVPPYIHDGYAVEYSNNDMILCQKFIFVKTGFV